MAWNRELAYACGEPGGVFHSLHPELSRSAAARVLEEAAKTGADVLITACAATLTSLQQANRTNLAVRDLVEVVADAVAGPDAGARLPTVPTR
jgi:Fe-S oxidoreductase